MINHTLRRSLSLLLAFFIVISCFSVTAIADEPSDSDIETTEPETRPVEETTEPETQAAEETTGLETQPAEETTEPETEATEAPPEPETQPSEASSEPTIQATDPTILPSEEPADTATEPTAATEETQSPTEPTQETAEPTLPHILPIDDSPEPEGPGLYFGQLHAHSGPVSGANTINELFQRASQTDGLDFFAITDHSDSFDNAASASLADGSVSQIWAAGKAAAQAVTSANFVGIYGFEMSWPERLQLGHISTFNTPGFQSWMQPPYDQQTSALKSYYDALSSVPGAVGQWNHPGNQYGTFSDFGHYCADTDRVLQLLEVGSVPDLAAPSGHLDGYGYYNRALDKGWHVAPTNNTGSGRTVILAQALTEAELYSAINSHRGYATQDSDLEIYYSMNGFPIGSVLKKRHIGETAMIVADLHDPTDSAIGQVEVIVDGGTVAARQMVAGNCDVLQFALPASNNYYYLRITQPDGDIAVTAPIWVEASENLGISDLTCETPIPVQNEDISLVLELHNRETADFLVESIQIFADNVPIAENADLTRIPAGSSLSHGLTFCYDGIGQTGITVLLSGTLEGAEREYEKSISLSFRQSRQVTDIVIDGSHGNAGLSDLGTFKAMAAAEDIRVTIVSDCIDSEVLENCRFLLVTAPSNPFSDDFLTTAAEYVRYGGSVLLCGQSTSQDGAISSAEELNRLLEAIGSTIRLNHDTLTDPIYNGGKDSLLFPENIDTESRWCTGITDAQVYRHSDGCSISPGQGSTLVASRSVTVSSAGISPSAVLCWEETVAGGTVLAAGNLFLGNTELNEPDNIWAAPFANRTIARNLLGIGGEALALSTIRQAREAESGTVLRIRGYVTAGTANHWNRFPRTLYVQDDTGGIAVIPFDADGIAVGTPVEIAGAAGIQNGNRILKPISHKALNTTFYRYLPKTGDWKPLLDAGLHGGELVEVEGACTEVILADDGHVSDILLKDSSENTAHVHIESCIFSGATGENDLHEDIQKGRKVRAMGILHVDENGDTVIRVRNCEEVVYVPPRKIYINPKTGDFLALGTK